MRQALINEGADLVAENRITGNDREGQDQLGEFNRLLAPAPCLTSDKTALVKSFSAVTDGDCNAYDDDADSSA